MKRIYLTGIILMAITGTVSAGAMDPAMGSFRYTGNNPFTFTAYTIPGSGPVEGYSWDFGDGSKGTGKEITHSYAAAGTYTVTLTAGNPYGYFEAREAVTVITGHIPPMNKAAPVYPPEKSLTVITTTPTPTPTPVVIRTPRPTYENLENSKIPAQPEPQITKEPQIVKPTLAPTPIAPAMEPAVVVAQEPKMLVIDDDFFLQIGEWILKLLH